MLSVDVHKDLENLAQLAFRGLGPGQVDVKAISQDTGRSFCLYSKLLERRSRVSDRIRVVYCIRPEA